VSTLLATPEARRGWHLGQACTELEGLIAAARWRRQWSHAQHDRAAALVRSIYAHGLLKELPMDPAVADAILARLAALAQSREMLLDDPAEFTDELTELVEEIAAAGGGPGPADLEP
jgi:hypothetical protein